ncbi:MAG: type 4a pilus biogenesis protein PilO [Actinobacteria bacterium]|nr:type 4a pilus biogenesis protein PilO [Actinomycetota bacterium]MBV8394634.1 type 4a pilus biogenesis protein PilO [Actinomycetota bacterium]MBV8599189.1 type 4a pilus biogenesis protein PilO [Actinomycetota bacterium]
MKRELNMKWLTRERLIFLGIPIAGLLFGLVGYMGLVLPQKSKASALDAQIGAAQMALVAPSHATKAPDAHAADLFRLTKAMPDTPDMAGIVLQLARLANQSSVTLDSIAPATASPTPNGYGVQPLGISIEGSYAAITKFMQLLRQQVSVAKDGSIAATGRLMLVDQLALQTKDAKTLTASVNLDTFVYGMTPPPAAPAGPTGASGATTTTTTTTTPTGSAG